MSNINSIFFSSVKDVPNFFIFKFMYILVTKNESFLHIRVIELLLMQLDFKIFVQIFFQFKKARKYRAAKLN